MMAEVNMRTATTAMAVVLVLIMLVCGIEAAAAKTDRGELSLRGELDALRHDLDVAKAELHAMKLERDALWDLVVHPTGRQAGMSRFETRVLGSDDVAVRQSTLRGAGRGAFANRQFGTDEVIGSVKCSLVPRDISNPSTSWSHNSTHSCDGREFPLGNPLVYANSVTVRESCSGQNVKMLWGAEGDLTLVAIKPLRRGQELVSDYGHDFFASLPWPRHASYECSMTQLHSASARGDTGEVLVFIEDPRAAGGDIDHAGTEGWTALMEASAAGHAGTVELLLLMGAKIHLCDAQGQSALFLAADRGHAEVVRKLLGRATSDDVNRCRYDGASPLSSAAERGHLEVAELLVTAGARINELDLLFVAAEQGNVEALRVLVHVGANPNRARPNDGMTPLFLAAQNGHSPVIELLLEEDKYSANEQEIQDVTPLMVASLNGHFSAASGEKPTRHHCFAVSLFICLQPFSSNSGIVHVTFR